MTWWHEWRARVWERRYIEALGMQVTMDRAGSWNQWDRQIEQAKEAMAKGLCAYHRLKAGIPV